MEKVGLLSVLQLLQGFAAKLFIAHFFQIFKVALLSSEIWIGGDSTLLSTVFFPRPVGHLVFLDESPMHLAVIVRQLAQYDFPQP